jgi:predicted PurR-regulated permease PerM
MGTQNRLLQWWSSLTPLGRTIAIALLAPLLVLNGWAIAMIFNYFHSLLVVLIVASLLTFLLNYPINFLEQHGVPRERAAIIVFLLAISVLFALGITLLPLAFAQAQQLVGQLPKWIDSGRQQLLELSSQASMMGVPINLDVLVAQITDRLKTQLQGATREVFSLAVFTVTSLLDSLLTLVLTFYLLQHGGELWQSLIDWLPTAIRQSASQTLKLSFQNFFIGQFIIATSLGTILTIVFEVLQVPFGFLFGLTIGTMALIPLGGTVGIILITLLVTLQNFWLGVKVLAAAVIVQQILENLVAPRVLGKVTGLNPVWVLLSILTGARVGGLLGVIIAVPTAVVIKNVLALLRSSDPPVTDAPPLGPPTVEAVFVEEMPGI